MIDWEGRWRALVEGGRGRPFFAAEAGGDPFARMAERFARGHSGEDPLLPMLLPLVQGRTVIDVGAGVGRYSLPLAAVTREVVAVEPSPAMRERLLASLAERAVRNVRVVPTSFQEAALEPADVVLCIHVVHFVADAPAFIRKADGLARAAVVFAIRHDPMLAGLGEIWGKYRGGEPSPQPRFQDLYNLLLAMGHAPNVTFYLRGHGPRFGSAEEARARARAMLGVDISDADASALARQEPRRLREACVWWCKG